MTDWPIDYGDIDRARQRIRPYLPVTPLRSYPELDEAVGHDIRVLVKHENHQPTQAFKARNAMSALTALSPEARERGIVAATRGNHGQGLAWAAGRLGIRCVICVPTGNSPAKNRAMVSLGAELIEDGADYDESVAVALALTESDGLHMVHSTNDADIIAGAGTMAMEIIEQADDLDAMVIAIGGGSQAVGALACARELRPGLPVYGVQAANASAIHDGWHAGKTVSGDSADTFADGLATRNCYEFTFQPLREGLAGFVTATEAQLAEAVRLLLRTTHNVAEGAGAAGLAGLVNLAEPLAGKTVAIAISGGNIDSETLRRILCGEM